MKNKKKLSLNKQVVDNIQLSKVVGGSANCTSSLCTYNTCRGQYSCPKCDVIIVKSNNC